MGDETIERKKERKEKRKKGKKEKNGKKEFSNIIVIFVLLLG